MSRQEAAPDAVVFERKGASDGQSGATMHVHWLEQTFAEVSPDTDWLCPAERAQLEAMRIAKRREDWRLGRWTAKHAVAAHLDLPLLPSALAAIEIRPAASGAPDVFIDDRAALVSVSLTHRDGRAVCAIAPAGTRLGCDLEVVEPRCRAFVADYFTPAEQELVARVPGAERLGVLALLWSAKESTLKALREGLRLDPRSVEVNLGEDAVAALAVNRSRVPSSPVEVWHKLSTRFQQQLFYGWRQCDDEFVLTMVSAPESTQPVRMRMVSHLANPPA